jgi:hypothetical protein
MTTQVTRDASMSEMSEMSEATRFGRASGSRFAAPLAAIFLMAAGWGWNAGNFVQPVNTSWGPMADALHVLPLALLLPLSLRYLGAALAGRRAVGARNAITGLALFGIIGCAVMIVLGAINPDPNSVGVHTPEDWMPVIVLNAGTLLWLATLLPLGRGARAARQPRS